MVSSRRTFESLVAEGNAVPTEGWDFGWFEGRATEERPPWHYADRLHKRMATANAQLDIQTGGGEVVGSAAHGPPILRATESWPPNIPIARERLAHLGGEVVEVADRDPLPFPDAAFDLVSSRHPTVVPWDEIARVLRPGGTYFSQQVGVASAHEVSVAMLGEFEPSQTRSPERAVRDAEAAGLEVIDLQEAGLRMAFFDLAAFIYFCRKVIWIVPNFDTTHMEPQLRLVHEVIERDGLFLAHSTRFLIEAKNRENGALVREPRNRGQRPERSTGQNPGYRLTA